MRNGRKMGEGRTLYVSLPQRKSRKEQQHTNHIRLKEDVTVLGKASVLISFMSSDTKCYPRGMLVYRSQAYH